jgi:teichoic acid transport system permease protein
VDNSGQNSARGQISAPGTLQGGAVITPDAPRVPEQNLGELARQYGLKLSGARPTLAAYLVSLWQRRHFITGYATARNVSMYTDAKLGQIWQVLTPLLNAGVYYLIFGELFQTSRAVTHFPAFLLVGVFVFAFTERSIVTGSNVMRANLQLIRALYFPRASLPLAYVIVELQQMMIGMAVVVVAMLASQQWPTWYWLLLIPIGVLQTMFNIGAALIVARLGGSLADVSELIPFFLRISRYFCGVMYLTITVTWRYPNWVQWVLSLNPFAVYISLFRVGFMSSYRQDSAGNQPYNHNLCQLFLSSPGHNIPAGTRVPTALILPGSHASSIVTTASGPLSRISNVPLQAYCHAIVSNHELWAAAVGWGVVAFAVGIVFFWRAEHLYGRG